MATDIWDQRLGFWRIAEDNPDRVAVAHSPDGPCSYGELAAASNRLVHALRSLGVDDDCNIGGRQNPVIAVLAPNGALLVQTSFACQQAGWDLTLVNAYLTSSEIVAVLEHADVAALIVHERYRGVLDGAEGDRVRELTRVIGAGDISGTLKLDSLLAEQPATRPPDRRDGGMIAYTSGTTGTPKGVRRPGTGGDPDQAMQDAAVFGRAFDFRPFEGPHLVSTAMYHGGSHSYYRNALNVGHALVIMAQFDAEEALRLIDRYQVRSAYMVATLFHRMLKLPLEVRERYDMSSLHSVVHSASPCPRPVKEAMFKWWGPVLWETYGGMEGAATIAKPHRWLEKPGTVGRAVRGVELAIFDDDGNRLGPNESGHIYYRTQAGFNYHRDKNATAEAHRGDMFSIGDIGYLDEDGYLFISDRAKDMIISGGVNIFPAEIEAVLLTHPEVADAAVIGVPDEEWGERVVAVVETIDHETGDHKPSDHKSSQAELAADLLAHCADHLAPFKRPREIEFRAKLPRTDAGKLYKRRLREEYSQSRPDSA